MKNLEAYMKNLYISLEGIDETLKDKIQNLEGYEINECCGCCDCGCCCEDPCPCEPECNKTCGTALSGVKPLPLVNQFGRFNSEQEIISLLDISPKVMDLLDIHSQFARFLHVADINKGYVEPLYFGHKDYALSDTGNLGVVRQNGDMPTQEANPESIEQLYDVATYQNKKIYKAVNDIVSTFELKCPVVETKINGEVQVYAVKHTGSNGKEGNIKTSLEEIAKVLGKLESRADVQWAQVLDVSIDNIDDLYAFVITFTFNIDKVREQIKANEIK